MQRIVHGSLVRRQRVRVKQLCGAHHKGAYISYGDNSNTQCAFEFRSTPGGIRCVEARVIPLSLVPYDATCRETSDLRSKYTDSASPGRGHIDCCSTRRVFEMAAVAGRQLRSQMDVKHRNIWMRSFLVRHSSVGVFRFCLQSPKAWIT